MEGLTEESLSKSSWMIEQLSNILNSVKKTTFNFLLYIAEPLIKFLLSTKESVKENVKNSEIYRSFKPQFKIFEDPLVLVLFFLIFSIMFFSSSHGIIYRSHHSFMSLLLMRGLDLFKNSDRFTVLLFFIIYFYFIFTFYSKNTIPVIGIKTILWNLFLYVFLCSVYDLEYILFGIMLTVVFTVLFIWSKIEVKIRKATMENYKIEKKEKEEKEKKAAAK